jgi:hypothetical protein
LVAAGDEWLCRAPETRKSGDIIARVYQARRATLATAPEPAFAP